MGMNVPVADEFARLIERKVESGRYGSAQDVVERALRMLDLAEREDEEKLAWLREAIREGEARGSVGALTADELKQEARRRRVARK
jgi:antitoxin ParD1/3/4